MTSCGTSGAGRAHPSRSAGCAVRRVGFGLLLVWAVAACGTSAPKPTRVEGAIAAAAGLNPSVNDRPSPLLLRIYELRSPTAFNQADFMALYEADQATLAADLVLREELMLQPGESRPFNKQLAAETRYIGVVAAYRNLERATWRAVVPVTLHRTQRFNVRADSLVLSATIAP